MKILKVILWDQLSPQLPLFKKSEKSNTVLLFIESKEQATYVKHHKKKLVFIFSAMRHFAETLKKEKWAIAYHKIDENSQSIEGILKKQIKQHAADRIEFVEPSDYWLLDRIKGLEKLLKTPITIHSDNRFIATHKDFKAWAEGKTTLTMEFFYREMRKKTGLLMDSQRKPLGGQWNFDKENRKNPPSSISIPKLQTYIPDKITQEVIKLVDKVFPDHFGDIAPFNFATNHKDAKKALNAFIKNRLPLFGDYQDAMVQDETFLFHSVLSHYINCGLLDPLEVCKKAEEAYYNKNAPLNAVEGFIRQVIGWREFIRGIYWHFMPKYKDMNALKAKTPLPDFFWGKSTTMNCMSQVVSMTKTYAYSHHIQRLMVTGNFSLLAGLNPQQVCEWYHIVYADAYEWVELPNTLGMALYADGGIVGTKPYIASGAYINRMSNFCKSCHHNVKEKFGDKACPFNYLYWDFLMRHEKRFRSNKRMLFSYKNLDRFSGKEKKDIQRQANVFMKSISKKKVDI